MKKVIFALVLMMLVISSLCWANCGTCEGTDPVTGALVASKEFVGTVLEVAAFQEPGSSGLVNVTVADESGKTEIFPIDQTVRILDAGLNVVTMDQLKKGSMISVLYGEIKGSKKATEVKIK